jgi:hypothetical protein
VKIFVALLTAAVCCAASAQLTQPVAFGQAVVVEQSSPGLVPSMKFDYINVYASDLAFVRTATTMPLLQAPGAITFSGPGDIFLAQPCDPSCVQIHRYQQSGSEMLFGDPIHDWIRSMQFVASGDLVVAYASGAFGRFDAQGRLMRIIRAPEAAIAFDFDVDGDQCTIVFSNLRMVAMINICSEEPVSSPLPRRPAADFFGVRFLPNGDILAGSRGAIYELDRRGATVRRFVTSEQDYGEVVLDPDGASFWTSSGNRLFRFDLITGNLIAGPVWLRNAAYGARSMAVRGEWRAAMNPARRRSVRR